MSIFSNKLRQFLNTNWDNEVDISLNNELISERSNMLLDEKAAQQFISNFIKNNKVLLLDCSEEFVEKLKELVTYITEGIIKEDDLTDQMCSILNNNIIMNKNTKTPLATGYEGQFEGDSRIQGLFESVKNKLNKENLSYDSDGLFIFLENNFSKIKNLCENDSKIDTYRIYALMEANDLKLDEMTTADISVPNLPITGSSLIRKRLNNFDPYGKNVANTTKNNKTIIKFDSNLLNEALNKINIDKINILATDLEKENKFSKIIIENKGNKKQLIINTNNFIDYVKNNADISNYINENTFNLKKYLSSRTNAFTGVLIKEYFKSILKEENIIENKVDDFEIDDFEIHNGKIIIAYYFPEDTEDNEVIINLSDFEEYIKDEFHDEISEYYEYTNNDYDNPKGIPYFDFNKFFKDFSYIEQNKILKDYLKSNKLISKKPKFETSDYNDWKSQIATISNNNYEIKRENNNSVITQAFYNDKIIGQWDPIKTLGIIY